MRKLRTLTAAPGSVARSVTPRWAAAAHPKTVRDFGWLSPGDLGDTTLAFITIFFNKS
jgi:hypothetical protein